MAEKVSDFIIERLGDWGVKRIFGYTGDSINPLMGALKRHAEAMDFIQVRHEEMAALMACAHAKVTGEVGVCCASAGPGSIHLLNGLYDAKLDQQPVVALLGQLPRHAMGTDYQQEVDLHSLFKDVASAYIQTINEPAQLRHALDQAMRVAISERTVTVLILPHDVQAMAASKHPPHKHHFTQSGLGYNVPKIVPHQSDLQRAAAVLNAGKKVAILIGVGAKDTAQEVAELSDRLGAGIAKSLMGLDVLPATTPRVTGSIGLLGTQPSWNLMSDCDTLLMLGTDFPYAEFLPKEGQARGVQIDLRPRNLSKRYPMEVNLHGNCRETLQALLPLLEAKNDRHWAEKIEKDCERWQKVLHERAMIEATPMNPQRLFYELFQQLPMDTIVATDTGTATVWYAQYHRFQARNIGLVSGRLATMGAGMPYALAAKYACPERPVIALIGDGAMQMNGMNELLTLARDWKKWKTPQFIVLVLSNKELNFVTWEMRAAEGDPLFETSQDIPDFPYATYAQSLGLTGLTLEKAEDAESIWRQAFLSDRPVLIEASVTPDMPPLPPHISLEQAGHYASAMMQGDPNTVDVIINSLKQIKETVFA
jgi:pyruvate dehydrogenase (quinone)